MAACSRLITQSSPSLILGGPEVVVTWCDGSPCQPLHVGALWPSSWKLDDPYSQADSIAYFSSSTNQFILGSNIDASGQAVHLDVGLEIVPRAALVPHYYAQNRLHVGDRIHLKFEKTADTGMWDNFLHR